MRVHRFAWPGIIRIAYRRNTFSIRLIPGEVFHFFEKLKII
jgi:hypothetical protein